MNDKWSPREVVHRDYSSHPPAYAPGYKTSVLRSPKKRPHLSAELAVRDHRPGI
ncbi:hypothetical protein LNO23_17185 [Klebsiella pneumoniae subsp. pneumoniae]|nr:hypothetical protein [Klebsiella pneumoniae subsp. pneumoniae]MCS5855935.1 hypothetical protein [Klebsiella pneumoniae subsp. pneumoniae]MCS6038730.1 hypothetical protein [Klebsiella pneumoniae subsp. pneumoniae]